MYIILSIKFKDFSECIAKIYFKKSLKCKISQIS